MEDYFGMDDRFCLCIDSASRFPGVCLFSLKSREEIEGVTIQELSSEGLLESLTSLLQRKHLTLEDIELVVISLGPGSFTGIRVGISTAKGIRFGRRNLKLLGASNLEAMAMAYSETYVGEVLCAIDAGRNCFFTQQFFIEDKYKVKSLGAPEVKTTDSLSIYEGEIVSNSDSWRKQIIFPPHFAKYLGLIVAAGGASEIIEPLYVSNVVYRKVYDSHDE